jgi:hypothetical protein
MDDFQREVSAVTDNHRRHAGTEEEDNDGEDDQDEAEGDQEEEDEEEEEDGLAEVDEVEAVHGRSR